MKSTSVFAAAALTFVVFSAGCLETSRVSDFYVVKDIQVVYQRLIKEGNTCTRCDQTGANVDKVVQQLQKELASQGVNIAVEKKALGEDEIPESNMVFINGEPIENIVPGVRVFSNDCKSCCAVVCKEDVKCRAIEYKGKQYNELPVALIREAILAVAKNLPRPPATSKPPEGKSNPCRPGWDTCPPSG